MEKGITRLVKSIDDFSRWANLISAWGLFGLMIIGITAIGMRWAGFNLQGAMNLSIYILVAIVYLSLAFSLLQKQQISVEFFVSKLKGKPKKIITIIATVLALASTSLILWSSWKMGFESWSLGERMDGYPFYPIYPAKIALVLGVLILWIQLVADLIKAFKSDAKIGATGNSE